MRLSSRFGVIALALGVLCAPLAATAQHLMVEGVLRDNLGKALEGTFDITYALYAAEDAEDAAWTETHVGQTVTAGFFQTRLGESVALGAALFADNPDLWLGITLAGQPELPRTPLETDPFAFRALSAGVADDLNCTGCVDATDLAQTYAASTSAGGAATLAVTAETANDLSCTGCVSLDAIATGVLDAANIGYDDSVTKLGATNVQTALEKLKDAIGTGGTPGTPGKVNEGNGTIVPYANQWGLPAYGVATEYVHLLNPTNPKVVSYLYGGENTGFSSANNLVVSNTFAPNKYGYQVSGTKGDNSLTVSNPALFNIGDHILIHQTVGKGGNGTDAGVWELNVVKAVSGNSVSLAKPLENTYSSKTGETPERAQAVIAASYNNLEVVNGGQIYPADTLSNHTETNFRGGIVYIRAQTISVKTGGSIHADTRGYYHGDSHSGANGRPGQSECKTAVGSVYGPTNNCSGGGGGGNGSCCSSGSSSHGSGAGGGNKTAGQSVSGGGTGGIAKGDANATTLQFGGGGGYSWPYQGGRGGGIVVLGAKTIVVEEGGRISANGQDGSGYTGGSNYQGYASGGGGAGGSVILFANQVVNKGKIEALGGKGGDNQKSSQAKKTGGDGGEGWVIQAEPVPGSVNQTFATGVEVWVDGVNVTASVGDPNGKGLPHYDAVKKKWGATGTEEWNSGQLDLTNVANWTLGQHKIEFKETGGAGGDLKVYTYVIYPFTESTAPENDSCSAPLKVDIGTEPTVISGSTEDTMGKTKATDAHSQGGCGGFGGPEVVYEVALTERSLLNAVLISPFSSKMYVRSATCADGELVYCADKELITNPLDPGKYFIFIDSDSAFAKGDFNLALSTTAAPLPANDDCDTAIPLVFGPDGKAVITGTNEYGLDQHKGLCPAAKSGGPDVVYEFTAATGANLSATIDGDFDSIMFVTTAKCGAEGVPLSCSATGSLNIQTLAGGKYWLFVDGAVEKEWGPFTLTVNVSIP